MPSLSEFLAGDLPDHVAIFLSDAAVDDAEALAAHGERVDGGVVLVVEGDRGRRVFRTATGLDVMALAGEATQNPGTVASDLAGGECPNATNAPQSHAPRFVFSFVEAQNEEVGGLYAEGDVVHAYAACECGQAYADKWVAGER